MKLKIILLGVLLFIPIHSFASKVRLEQISTISASVAVNDSSVSGATVKDALETLSSESGGGDTVSVNYHTGTISLTSSSETIFISRGNDGMSPQNINLPDATTLPLNYRFRFANASIYPYTYNATINKYDGSTYILNGVGQGYNIELILVDNSTSNGNWLYNAQTNINWDYN